MTRKNNLIKEHTLVNRLYSVVKYTLVGLQYVILVLIFALAAVLFLSALNNPLGLKAFALTSGSMEPAVKVGSLVFTTAPGGYGVGDIVTFQPDSSHHTTTHRIVDSKLEASADNDVEFVYTTKGDANEDPDINTIRETAVLGKVRLTIPYLGYPLLWAKTQKGYIFLIIVPSTVVVYSELLNIKSELISLVDKRKNKGKITTLADF